MDQSRLLILPFFGLMDMMMFSMMFSMMGIGMSDYVSQENIPNDGYGMNGGMDDGGFDLDIGF